MRSIAKPAVAGALLGALALAGCGSSSSSHGGAAPASATSPASTTSPASSTSPQSSPGTALSADATSAATGDIPDSQVFLVFTSRAAGYSIKYPEGWTEARTGRDVTFRDKNNLVRVHIASGAAPTPASVTAQLSALRQTDPTLSFRAAAPVRIGAGRAIKVVYTTESAPNPVTGKRVKLVVDRYEMVDRGRVAIVDLGTPVGVDNVDAYRMMIESFRWL